jgi:hypothetical protein
MLQTQHKAYTLENSFLMQENAALLWNVVQSNELIQSRYGATQEQRVTVARTFDRLFPMFSAAERDSGMSLLDMNKKFILTLITELNTQYNRGAGVGAVVPPSSSSRKPEVLHEAWEQRQQAYQTELARPVPPTPAFADSEMGVSPIAEDQLNRRMKQTMAEREQEWEQLRRTLPNPTPATQTPASTYPSGNGILKRIRIQEEEEMDGPDGVTSEVVQLPGKQLTWSDEVPPAWEARLQALEAKVAALEVLRTVTYNGNGMLGGREPT